MINTINKISFKLAVNMMLLLFTSALVFHLLVISQIIPFDIVWGGRLNSVDDMLVFESVSIVINLIVLAVVAIKGGLLKPLIPMKLVNIILWIMVGVFALNTVGNVFALNSLEAVLFTPLTLIGCVLCLRMVSR